MRQSARGGPSVGNRQWAIGSGEEGREKRQVGRSGQGGPMQTESASGLPFGGYLLPTLMPLPRPSGEGGFGAAEDEWGL